MTHTHMEVLCKYSFPRSFRLKIPGFKTTLNMLGSARSGGLRRDMRPRTFGAHTNKHTASWPFAMYVLLCNQIEAHYRFYIV